MQPFGLLLEKNEGITKCYCPSDASCFRFSEPKPEPPFWLTSWNPIWHSESEKPEIGVPVLASEKMAWGEIIYTTVHWSGEEWHVEWNDKVYTSPPDWWTGLPYV